MNPAPRIYTDPSWTKLVLRENCRKPLSEILGTMASKKGKAA